MMSDDTPELQSVPCHQCSGPVRVPTSVVELLDAGDINDVLCGDCCDAEFGECSPHRGDVDE